MSTIDPAVAQRQRQQLLKLVAKGFYRELVKYGVAPEEVLSVASHLLGNIDPDGGPAEPQDSLEGLTLQSVDDRFRSTGVVDVDGVSLHPLRIDDLAALADWLGDEPVRTSFVPAFPATIAELHNRLLANEQHEYFSIVFEGAPVGVVGGERIERDAGKLEMKKLIGVPDLRRQGVGTRATFGFLYHAFAVRGMHKVYLHSRNTNITNLNLNSRFGFELEGTFFEELALGEQRVDVIRMGLLRRRFEARFGALA